MNYKEFLKIHQMKLVHLLGYVMVAIIGIGLGRMIVTAPEAPEIKVEEAFNVPSNYSQNILGIQSESKPAVCQGQIKGSSSFIYHLPGGAFYDRTTNPVRCFDTEAEAIAAGFRKSSK